LFTIKRHLRAPVAALAMAASRAALGAALGAALVAPTRALAGPLDTAIVDPASKWVVHADLEAARASTVGAYLETSAGVESTAFIAQMKGQFGIDPSKDLFGVTVFGGDPGNDDGIAAIEMSIVADTLGKSLPAAGFADFAPLALENNIEGWRWTMDGRGWFVARIIARPSDRAGDRRLVLLAPSEARLVSAVRIANARVGSTGVASTTAPEEGSILFAAARGLGDCPAFQPDAAVLKRAENFTFDLRETTHASGGPGERAARTLNAHVRVGTRSAEEAVQIHQMLQGVLAFASLATSDDPKLAKLVAAWTNSLTMKTDANAFTVEMSQDSASVIQMLDALKGRTDIKPTATPKPTSAPTRPE